MTRNSQCSSTLHALAIVLAMSGLPDVYKMSSVTSLQTSKTSSGRALCPYNCCKSFNSCFFMVTWYKGHSLTLVDEMLSNSVSEWQGRRDCQSLAQKEKLSINDNDWKLAEVLPRAYPDTWNADPEWAFNAIAIQHSELNLPNDIEQKLQNHHVKLSSTTFAQDFGNDFKYESFRMAFWMPWWLIRNQESLQLFIKTKYSEHWMNQNVNVIPQNH